MSNIKNQRQDEAIQEWVENGYVGTVMAVPAFGKTWVFFKALYAALEAGKIHKGNIVWFFAETTERQRDLEREAVLFHKTFGKDPYKDFRIEFKTIQSQPVGERVFDCYDENSSLLF